MNTISERAKEYATLNRFPISEFEMECMYEGIARDQRNIDLCRFKKALHTYTMLDDVAINYVIKKIDGKV